MGELRQCEFSLVRYVPDVVKNEFVNIGVLVRDQARPEQVEVRFTRDWTRVRCIDPHADIAMLEALEAELRLKMGTSSGLLQLLEDTLSNAVQITEPKGCLGETFLTQVEQLMRSYVEPVRNVVEKKRRGRSPILAEMRRQFERAQVWDLMTKRIAAEKYTGKGDPLHIDCGYRTNGTMKMFQAVSLDTDIDAAIKLAFASKSLTKNVKELENAKLELTAIVEPSREIAEDRIAQYKFADETMRAYEIRVMTVTHLPQIAATAAADLRV